MDILEIASDVAEITFVGDCYAETNDMKKIGVLSAILMFIAITAAVMPTIQI